MTTERMNRVLIFRQQLFKVSEQFIPQQACGLKRYKPVHCGRMRFGDGPRDAESLALQDLGGLSKRGIMTWQAITRDPRPYEKLIRSAGRATPKLIHAHFGVDGVQALSLAKRLGIPLVTTFHGFDATMKTSSLLASRSPSLVNYVLHRPALAKGGQLFLCVSRFIRERVLELGFPEERTRLHYIGIDTNAIGPRKLSEERNVVLHVARLVEKKGTEYLIRAFAKIVKNYPETRLRIVGDGPLAGSLAQLCETLGISQRIDFVGAQAHEMVLQSMREARVFVVPSVTAKNGDTEGLPIVLLEAAATAVPIIGTCHAGIPEAIKDGLNGYLVPERDVDALADRLSRVLADADRRQSMGQAARRLVEEKFNLRHQCSRLEEIYDEMTA